jgi:hypothetical protein
MVNLDAIPRAAERRPGAGLLRVVAPLLKNSRCGGSGKSALILYKTLLLMHTIVYNFVDS